MKSGTYIPFLTLIIIPLAITIAFSAESIVDYYRDIPLESLKGHRYRLELKGKKWISRSCANYAIFPVVDIKNRYLKITDKGTGGGVIDQELALFKARGGTIVIAVALAGFDGAGFGSSLEFYRPMKGSWEKVTSQVFPKIDLSLFLHEKAEASKFAGDTDHPAPVHPVYRLPRHGSTVTVTLGMAGLDQAGDAALLQQVKYREIHLAWDAGAGLFSILKKIPFITSPSDANRALLLKALAQELKKQSGQKMSLEVKHLNISGPWAWFHAMPKSADGKNIYEDLSGLMKKTKGQWKLLEMMPAECPPETGCEEEALYFKKLKGKYPAMPAEILPPPRR